MNSNKIGLSGLLFTGIGSIVGSGWLMSSYLIASISGPSAILSWVIGSCIILIIAFNFIEVCGFLPAKNGGFGHYVEYTHNSALSFIVEWVFLLSWIGLIPAEATATVQYLGSIIPGLREIVISANGNGLTTAGSAITSLVCLSFFAINYASMLLLMRLIKYLTLLKILVPVFVAIVLFIFAHNFKNLGLSEHAFMPYGYHGMLESITTGGVVFAFIGFQTPVTFAGSALNPKRNIPLAILFSVIFCTVIYSVLQLAYILAVPHDLIVGHGWKSIVYTAPFINLSEIYHLNYLVWVLSIVAFIAPFSAGLVFYASAVKITTGFGEYLPKMATKKHKDTPIGSLIFVLFGSLAFIWLLPGWQEIVSVICVSLIILFAMMCLVNGALSKHTHYEKREHGIKIKGGKYFAVLGYVSSSLMYFWSSWPLTWKGLLVLAIGSPIYFIFHSKKVGFKETLSDFISASWLIVHILILTLISYLSPFGGIGYLSSGFSQLTVIVISIIFYYIGLNNSQLSSRLNNHVAQLK